MPDTKPIETRPEWRIAWGATLFSWGRFTISVAGLVMTLATAIVFLLFVLAAITWTYEKAYRFDQPRDALVMYLPGYNDAYREMRDMCLATDCPQTVLDEHVFAYREQVIKQGWPTALQAMLDKSLWSTNDGDGWAIRDDWFALVAKVGVKRMEKCPPIVEWHFSHGVVGALHEVKGFNCGSEQFFLKY